jgi:chromosome segregation ATPase
MRHDGSVLEDNIRDLEKQLRHIRDETSQKEKHSREASSAKTIDLESNIRSLETELSRVKEEYASMAARAASALQQAKVAKAEADSLRAETSSIVSDGHTSHAALMQALQRIQQLETELVRAKTEKEVLQQDMDKQYSELRKYQDVSISKDGKTQLTEMELKRSKAHFEVSDSY